jgi:hypothetical protein
MLPHTQHVQYVSFPLFYPTSSNMIPDPSLIFHKESVEVFVQRLAVERRMQCPPRIEEVAQVATRIVTRRLIQIVLGAMANANRRLNVDSQCHLLPRGDPLSIPGLSQAVIRGGMYLEEYSRNMARTDGGRHDPIVGSRCKVKQEDTTSFLLREMNPQAQGERMCAVLETKRKMFANTLAFEVDGMLLDRRLGDLRLNTVQWPRRDGESALTKFTNGAVGEQRKILVRDIMVVLEDGRVQPDWILKLKLRHWYRCCDAARKRQEERMND